MSGDPSADRPAPLPPDDQAIDNALAWVRRAIQALDNLDSALGPAVGARHLRRDARQDIGLGLLRAAKNAEEVLAERDWVAAVEAIDTDLAATVLRLMDAARAACWGLGRHPYRDFRANEDFLQQIRDGLMAPRHAFRQLCEALSAARLLRRGSATTSPGEGDRQQPQRHRDPPPLALTDYDLDVLTILDWHRGRALTLTRIREESVRFNLEFPRDHPLHVRRLSKHAIRKCVVALERARMVARPQDTQGKDTQRKGVAITEDGHDALARARPMRERKT
jgi:hypothetical protein